MAQSAHNEGEGSDEGFVSWPTALIHWIIAGCTITCYLSGYVIFNMFWHNNFLDREMLFIIHRSSGMIAALFTLVWLAIRGRQIITRLRVGGMNSWIKFFHFIMAIMITVIVSFALIGRSLDGRTQELYTLLPVYNLVSRPDTPWAHFLIHHHGRLAHALALFAAFHMAIGIRHYLDERRYRRILKSRELDSRLSHHR